MVGTVKKSTETVLWRWFSRKVLQVWDGGFRCGGMYLATLVSPTSTPSLSNSPWMRGAPHSGFSRLNFRMSLRTSFGTVGLPGFPRRTFQVQNIRKPLRCQPMTVSGLRMSKERRQSTQAWDSQAHRSRSAVISFGRFTERRRTASWCRNARFSTCRAVRDLKLAAVAATKS